ncbi:phenylalanyl-tRNA synthetase, alpha subunit [Granulicella rosea]|uniref:Phenylalanine--tRNA ligase alpha subunit n=1 Tax=Granulicella rosea TaxID=474952 RepID=A0A239KNB3_9BACT|nr:phenylalanine--tRNA ligase subunit alpha [Granulicella rosea]SNT19877.1 phenylalanyl-tRNA synthetase, alpha subunit [Granulicella rosea]
MSTTKIPSLNDYSATSLQSFFGILTSEFESDRSQAHNRDAFEALRVKWVGRKQGLMNEIGDLLKTAPPEARRDVGTQFNAFKKLVEAQCDFEAVRDEFHATMAQAGFPVQREVARGIDITLPGAVRTPGIAHPLLQTMEAVVKVFHQLGYSTSLGPQVETDFYNFEALNFPPNHPARDTQDTLQIAGQSGKPSRDRLLMRTHTSPVQIRSMVAGPPPLRIVIPGKVHRNDAADATHSPIFHQVEGLCVDTNITFSDLKGTLDHAMRALFGSAVKTRFFPSFFPFTEPSADVQISCIFCGGSGCRKCKHSGWIELLGCGMVDPAVFASVTEERRKLGFDDNAYDPARISGFAFGMGVERIAMILHGVSDIGQFYSGDMRFLEQFA